MGILNWLCRNKEWFFSGLGIAILSVICDFFRKFLSKSNKNARHIIKQTNKGDNTTQIGIQNNYYTEDINDE